MSAHEAGVAVQATTIRASDLRYVSPTTILCEGWARPRELGCIAEENGEVVLGVWPDSDEPEEFDEYRLQPDDEVEVIEP